MDNLDLKELALNIRKTIIQGAHDAGNQGVHIGGALSVVEILAALYGRYLKYNLSNPMDENRDRVIFSKGHDCLALYATLAAIGFISREELKDNYLKDGGFLPTHPVKNISKGIECSSGSLGMGLSYGIGTALALKKKGLGCRVFVIMGDGECDEGSCWEAFIAARQYRLDNLILFIDKNGLQSDGAVSDIMPINLQSSLTSLGWNVCEVDGHNVESVCSAIQDAISQKEGTPSVIIADTVKGKGVSFMENDNAWHHAHMSQTQYEQSLSELENGNK